MSISSRRALFWAPRALSILLIIFISLFALDVFNEHLGFWDTLRALAIHLTPSFVLAVALLAAWRWEWIGALIYAAAGVLYVMMIVPASLPAPSIKAQRIAALALPAFVIGVLFLANWVKHSEIMRGGRDSQEPNCCSISLDLSPLQRQEELSTWFKAEG
jgi:hypothetical protein